MRCVAVAVGNVGPGVLVEGASCTKAVGSGVPAPGRTTPSREHARAAPATRRTTQASCACLLGNEFDPGFKCPFLPGWGKIRRENRRRSVREQRRGQVPDTGTWAHAVPAANFEMQTGDGPRFGRLFRGFCQPPSRVFLGWASCYCFFLRGQVSLPERPVGGGEGAAGKKKSVARRSPTEKKAPALQPVFTNVRRHLAQRVLCCLRFPCQTAAFCKFGRKARRVARFEKLRLWPKVRVFPQFSHFAIAMTFQFRIRQANRGNSTTAVGSEQDVLQREIS